MPAGNERVLIERLIAGMAAVIDELPPDERRRAIEAIRAVDRENAYELQLRAERRFGEINNGGGNDPQAD